jgi:single-stranded-DNA-specific exonuclease
MKTKIWKILAPQVSSKGGPLKSQDILSILLKNRGLETKEEIKEFLDPTSPSELSLRELKIKTKEVNKAILRVKKAQENDEKIIIFGDYDADGVCASAVLWETFFSLKIDAIPYIPDRFSEGYGIKSRSVRELKTKYPNLGLIITVDNGIVASSAINTAKKLGIDVIITDHHQKVNPITTEPKAYAIIHTTEICGTALAWIFSREIIKFSKTHYCNSPLSLPSSLDLVAIGTIADQLPLIGPNRSFVKYGLKDLRRSKRIGLLELFKEAGLIQEKIGVYEIGFIIAPRINSMGRLKHAIDSLRLLCTRDRNKATRLADLIGKTNLERQKIVDEVLIHAKGKLSDIIPKIIILSDNYHEGVIGLAAAKLVEEFYRPAIVISKKEKIGKGSARSIHGFDITKAIRKLDHLIIEGGGHEMAAGFSINIDKIEIFQQKIQEIASEIPKDLFRRKLPIDLEIEFDKINWDLIKIMEKLEPYGIGNPTPTFVTYKVKVLKANLIGKDQKHLKLTLQEQGSIKEAIAFNFADIIGKLKEDSLIDIVYSVEKDTWNGGKKVQLKIKDIKTK